MPGPKDFQANADAATTPGHDDLLTAANQIVHEKKKVRMGVWITGGLVTAAAIGVSFFTPFGAVGALCALVGLPALTGFVGQAVAAPDKYEAAIEMDKDIQAQGGGSRFRDPLRENKAIFKRAQRNLALG